MFGIKDLRERYAKERGITSTQATSEVDSFLKVLKDLIVEEGISIKGLFTIKHHIRKGRTGKKPNSQETYTTQDKTVLKIKTGSSMDVLLNK